MVAFRDRRRAPDWNQVAQAREIDEVVRNGDNGLEDIQTLLDNITFCNLRRDSARQSHDLIIKGFEYAQLTIEYLLNVQEQLSSALAKSQEELEEQTARVEEVTRNERIQERRARTGAKKLRNCQSTLQAASRMLVQFGVDTTPLRRMSEEDQMDGAPAPEYVWVPAYLDPYDGKAFQSADYLKKHMYTRHAQQIKADLGYYNDAGILNEIEEGGSGAPRPFENPKDKIQASAQRILEEVMGAGSRQISRKMLLKELQSLKINPEECTKFSFPRPVIEGHEATTTVHDLLHSRECIDISSSINEAIVLDWRGVDAHLRLLCEIDTFLRSDLQKKFAQALKEQGRETVATANFKETEDLKQKAGEIFSILDEDRSQSITHDELLRGFMEENAIKGGRVREALGFPADLFEEKKDESRHFIKTKMSEMDSDGNGVISKEEFLGFLQRIESFKYGFEVGKSMGYANGLLAGENMHGGVDGETMLDEVHRPEAITLFQKLDPNGTGTIIQTRFVNEVIKSDRAVRGALGFQEGVTAKDAEAKFRKELDANGDGAITFDEIGRFLDRFKIFCDGYLAAAEDNNFLELGEGAGGGGEDIDPLHVGTSQELEALADGAIAEGTIEPLPDVIGADIWFELQVISAANLLSRDANGKSDPFVIIKVQKGDDGPLEEVWKSERINKTLWPRYPSTSSKKAIAILKGLPIDDKFSILVELWDSDGVFFTSKEFLGCCILSKNDLLHVGSSGPLVPKRFVLHAHPDRNINVQGIKGSVELAWHAKTTVNFSLLRCNSLRKVTAKGVAPHAYIRMHCHGCEIKDARREKKAKTVHLYESTKCNAAMNPMWKGEKKTIEVPLDRFFSGIKIEVMNKQEVIGTAILSPRDILTSCKELTLTLLETDHENVRRYDGVDESTALVSKQKDGQHRAVSGTITLGIEAPSTGSFKLYENLYKVIADSVDKTRSMKAPWFECMEVEITVLRAQNLRKKVEPFAQIFLDGELRGKTNTKDTSTQNPVFRGKDNNTFALSVPFPAHLAQPITPEGGYGPQPSTIVRVELWDRNSIMKDEFLGQIELDWTTLIYPSLKSYKLKDKPIDDDFDVSKEGEKEDSTSPPKKAKKVPTKKQKPASSAGAQGSLTLQIRQLQMFEVNVIGAYGLLPADNGRTSDPFVQLSLKDKTGWTSEKERVVLRTEVKDKTLSPQFYHRFCFSKALTLSDSSLGKDESKLRREQLRATVDDVIVGSDKQDVIEMRTRMGYPVHCEVLLFPGLWQETKGSSSKGSKAETKYSSFHSFAVEDYRIAPRRYVPLSTDGEKIDVEDAAVEVAKYVRDPAFQGNIDSHNYTFDSCDDVRIEPWMRYTNRKLSMQVSVWDKDSMSKDDFMGSVELSEDVLRSPPLNVLTLKLKDDKKLNVAKHPVTGWIELQARASVPPEITESAAFQRYFAPPEADVEPVMDVMISELKAKGVAAADSNGFSDPFVTLWGDGIWVDGEIRTQEYIDKSRIVRRTLNPDWKEERFTFSMPVDPVSISGFDEEEEDDFDKVDEHITIDEMSKEQTALALREPSINNKAKTRLEIKMFDHDFKFAGIGKDDFIGRAILNYADLLTLDTMPTEDGWPLLPDDYEMTADGGIFCASKRPHKDTTKRTSRQAWNFCKTIDIDPISGHFMARPIPFARLEFTFMAAFNLLPANYDRTSDPYIKIRVKDELSYRITKKGYVAESGLGRRTFKTTVKNGTLNPVWYGECNRLNSFEAYL